MSVTEARVLIVDDDWDLVSLMSAFLSEQGFRTAAAHDGPSGLKAALSGQHDLMQKLYQREATPFERSIDVHISHLRRKLEGPTVLIRTVRGVGCQFVSEKTERDA